MTPAMHPYLRHQVIIMIPQVTRCIGEEQSRIEPGRPPFRYG